MDKKKDIRREVLARRDKMSEKERCEKSTAIIRQLITTKQFEQADCIYCYVNFRSEVETCDFIAHCIANNKKVAVPKICGDEMFFYFINDFSELECGYYGILEPKTSILANAENALVIMPGAAFDTERNRIGYGKGFYDRFLDRHRNFTKIALAFSCQVLPYIPSMEYDIKPDIIITEEHIYESIAK